MSLSSPPVGYVELPASSVVHAVNKYMENRDNHIQKSQQKLVDDTLAEAWTWHRKLLRRAPLTRADVVKALECDTDNEYHMLEIEGGYWARQLAPLKSAGEAALRFNKDSMLVSATLIPLLEPFLEKDCA